MLSAHDDDLAYGSKTARHELREDIRTKTVEGSLGSGVRSVDDDDPGQKAKFLSAVPFGILRATGQGDPQDGT